MALTRDEALALLTDSLSARRRRGAKRLRALADPTTATEIRIALEREVLDKRTWETQYQLIMALGTTGLYDDIERLKTLALQPCSATMVSVALGDAIVRLGRKGDNDPSPALWCLRQGPTSTISTTSPCRTGRQSQQLAGLGLAYTRF